LSIDTKRENGWLMYKEKIIHGEAELHNRSLMLSITPEARPPHHEGYKLPASHLKP
jgi:hypothetical protein